MNLIVRTTKRTFVFDVIPVTSGHQDLIQVRGAFGSPLMKAFERASNTALIAPTDKSRFKIIRRVEEGKIE